jgi:hypothetical protein
MREETYFEDQSTGVHELHIPDMDLRFKHPSQMLPKESAIESAFLTTLNTLILIGKLCYDPFSSYSYTLASYRTCISLECSTPSASKVSIHKDPVPSGTLQATRFEPSGLHSYLATGLGLL